MRSVKFRWTVAALVCCGVMGLAAAPAGAAGSATATCRGSATFCEATFSLAGGASNKRLTARLTDTNLRLLAVNATPAFVHGAYRLFGGRFTTGGSVYTVGLDAVQGIPAGAKLIMTFGHVSTGLRCTNNPNGVSFISIVQTGSTRPGAYSCSEAKAFGAAWLARFKAHQNVQSFTATGIAFRCRLVPTLPQNIQCDGGGLRVRFSGPTG